MSEPTKVPDKTPGTGLQKKYGPLPLWVYLTSAGAIVLILMYRKNSAANAAQQTQTDTTGQGQIPQFVNQVYTDTSPPDASAPPTNSDPGTTTPTPTPPSTNQPGSAATSTVKMGDGIRVVSPQTKTAQITHAQGYVDLAHRFGLSPAAFGALNPKLESKYYRNSGHIKVPVGTKVNIIPGKKPVPAPKHPKKPIARKK